MLTLGASSSCDVCLEDYAADRLPHVYPCGHLTCGQCCFALRERVCPYCREPFARESVRRMHVDFPATPRVEDGEPDTGAPVIARVEAAVPPARHNATCDVCRRTIEGERYKCTDCPDWDSCAACFTDLHAPHRQAHTFVCIRDPADYFQSPTDDAQARHPAFCDVCTTEIRGIRYKCSHPTCPDYDLCACCEAALPPVHPPSHVMLKIRVPNFSAHARAIFEGDGATVTCDGCARRIRGLRYKCTHPACPDLDICEACHARPPHALATHPAHHELAILRTAGLLAGGMLCVDAWHHNQHGNDDTDDGEDDQEDEDAAGGSPPLTWDGDIPEEIAFAMGLGLHEIESEGDAGMAGVGAGWR